MSVVSFLANNYSTYLHWHALKIDVRVCSFSMRLWGRVFLFSVLKKLKTAEEMCI